MLELTLLALGIAVANIVLNIKQGKNIDKQSENIDRLIVEVVKLRPPLQSNPHASTLSPGQSENNKGAAAQLKNLPDRLKQAIGSESVDSFAARCGMSTSTVQSALKGTMPSTDEAERMAKQAGVSLLWLMIGQDPMRPAANAISLDKLIPTLSQEQLKDMELKSQFLVRLVHQVGGNPIPEDLREALLGASTNKDDATVVINIQDESMAPTLPDGCCILVDQNKRRRQSGHIYALRIGDDLVVQRLYKSKKARHWQLVSDNPDWEPVRWNEEVNIVGEVVWAAIQPR